MRHKRRQKFKTKMKIKVSLVRALLVAVGFEAAKSWKAEDFESKITGVPDKIKADDVPEDHRGTYDAISNAVAANEKIELVDDAKGDAKSAKSAPSKKPEGKKDSKGKAKSAKSSSAKPIPAKKTAKGKKQPKDDGDTEGGEVDAFGAPKDSVRGRIHAVLEDKDWHTPEEVAEIARTSPEIAYGRLRRMARMGHFEVERIIRYRLKSTKK